MKKRKNITSLFVAALAIVVSNFNLVLAKQENKAPNIIIILADDLGIGDTTCYNPDSKIPTPNIDRLANEGMMFTDAHAPASICVPSRYGLLTGRYPFREWSSKNERIRTRNGVEWVNYSSTNLRAHKGKTTIASLLKSNGYKTSCFGKWHLGISHVPDENGVLDYGPTDHGFDYYFGIDAPEIPPYAFIENNRFVVPPTDRIEEQLGVDVINPKAQGAHWYAGKASPDWDFNACLPTINQKSVDYIKENAKSEKPYFMYLSYPAPHAPWFPTEQFKGKSGAGQYGDYVMTLDWCIGKVLDALEATGTKDNTLVIFSSDNGAYWLKEDLERFDHRANLHYKGGKGSLYEGGHRMPFLARWPEKIKAGSTSDKLVCFTDMMATFAEMVGTNLPSDAGEDSFSMLPYLLDEKPQGLIRQDLVNAHYGVYTIALRKGDYKLILPYWVYKIKDRTIEPEQLVDTSSKRYPKIVELYNLKDDPSETKNLTSEMPEKAQEMFEALVSNIKKGKSR